MSSYPLPLAPSHLINQRILLSGLHGPGAVVSDPEHCPHDVGGARGVKLAHADVTGEQHARPAGARAEGRGGAGDW